MRRLLFTQTYLERTDQARLFRVSYDLARKLNPDCDLLVIDNASPNVNPRRFVSGEGEWKGDTLLSDAELIKIAPKQIVRFKEAVGHPFKGGKRDGFGRGMTKAVELAIANGYDQLAYVEADTLCAKPVPPTDALACLPLSRFGWHDYSVFSLNLRWADHVDFVGRYDWARDRDWRTYAPEATLSEIAGEDLEILPFSGSRIEFEDRDLSVWYPSGMDWITHAKPEQLKQFLNMNGQHALAREV